MAMAGGLHDAAPEIRREAAESLQRLGPRAAPAWAELVLSLDDDDPGVQEAAMEALHQLGISG
jgi:HEAT repeat protein